jgi:tetratricopeptide (TPR) repeat protein
LPFALAFGPSFFITQTKDAFGFSPYAFSFPHFPVKLQRYNNQGCRYLQRSFMKQLFIVLWVCLFSLVYATTADGDRALEAGDYQEAINQYQAAVDLRADNVEALYKLAKAKVYLAETVTGAEAEALYSQAADHARAAIALAPDDPNTHMELARALGRLAQFKGILQSLNLAAEVKSELEKALELDPNFAPALHALALWNLNVPWIAGGRTAQVRPLFDQSIAAEPEEIVHYTDYGEALIQLGDNEAARVQLEKALTLPVVSDQDMKNQEKAKMLLAQIQ